MDFKRSGSQPSSELSARKGWHTHLLGQIRWRSARRALAMARRAALALTLAGLTAGPAAAESMQVFPNGSRPTVRGPAANFTGAVRVDPQFGALDQSRVSAGHVMFEPGARSAWHTHPAGQILIVTSGTGWVQEWNGQKREIKPGDVIWTPPGVRHWHGATATNAMSHLAIQESVDGKNVEWMEQVSDDQYGK
jgi:quercetin dioxygenase-like cupin family protein